MASLLTLSNSEVSVLEVRTPYENRQVEFWLSWARLTMLGQARIGEDGKNTVRKTSETNAKIGLIKCLPRCAET